MKKCKRCNKDFDPLNPKGKFCSDNCRVYWHRENPKVSLKNFNKKKEESSKKETTNDNKNGKHKLWQEGDPQEGSNAFFLRKGVFTYDEIEK